MKQAECNNEKNRLLALQRYEILDTLPELDFDDFTHLASVICQAPIALISLVDENRQWFKSRVGIEISETHWNLSFCIHTLQRAELMEVPDALLDERFCTNPLVTGDPHIRFYAGAPLMTQDQYCIGTLCVIDTKPRLLTHDQRDSLVRLARQVLKHLESRLDHKKLAHSTEALRESKECMEQIVASALDAVVTMGLDGLITSWNPQAEVIFGWSSGEVLGRKMSEVIIPPSLRSDHERGLQHLIATGEAKVLNRRLEVSALRRDGVEFPVELTIAKVLVGGEVQFSAFLRDLSEIKSSAYKLARTSDLLREVGRLQSRYILSAKIDPAETFEELLQILLNFTQSDYGFVAEVLRDEQEQPYIKTHAITNVAWNDEMRDFYEKHKASGLEFRNLNTLFGVALVTGETVISNSPSTDPRRGGLPPGHPPMNSFLGVPIKQRGEMIAMIGVANRLGGYNMDLVAEIEPLLSTYATIIQGYQYSKQKKAYLEKIEVLNLDLQIQACELSAALEENSRIERKRLEILQEYSFALEQRVAARTAELEHSKRQFQDLFECGPDAYVMTDANLVVQMLNHKAEQMFGWTHAELLGQSLKVLLPTAFQEGNPWENGRFFDEGEKPRFLGRRKSGTEFPLELSLSPLQTDGSTLLAAAMRDVSERIQLEQEVARISSHEQERISHELHDHLGAYFAGIAFRCKSLAESLELCSLKDAVSAHQLVGQVNDGIDLVRNFARLLSPVDIEAGGLPAGLNQLAKETEEAFRIKCGVDVVKGLPHLTSEQSIQLYRIAQEATRNAIQHAKAQQVILSLDFIANKVILTVSNDGKPWSANPERISGMGLRIMRHRAVNLGGTLTISSALDGYTSVTCQLPIPLHVND